MTFLLASLCLLFVVGAVVVAHVLDNGWQIPTRSRSEWVDSAFAADKARKRTRAALDGEVMWRSR